MEQLLKILLHLIFFVGLVLIFLCGTGHAQISWTSKKTGKKYIIFGPKDD